MSARTSSRVSAVETLEERNLLSLVVGLADGNRLVTFDSENPGIILDRQKVLGLQKNDDLVGIDYRPATGELWGLGKKDFVYKIDPISGQATTVGSKLALAVSDTASFGFDFNPAVDRIRIVNSDDQNLRANPNTGAAVDSNLAVDGIQPDGTLAYAGDDANAGQDPSIVGVAYTNNVPAGTPTTLYGIDSSTNTLVTIGSLNGTPDSPNGGLVRTIGSLGVNVTAAAGFDIVTVNGVDTAYAALQVDASGKTEFFQINLSNGAATSLGQIGDGARLFGLAVVPAGDRFYALAEDNRLQLFESSRPDVALFTTRITGLARGEQLAGIDFRPATGELFAVGRSNRIYTINVTAVTATQVGPTFASPFSATGIGFDFNPTVDRIRLVGTTNQNFRLNPITGAVVDFDPVTPGLQVDGNLFYADGSDPDIAHVAYANSFAGATVTELYGIDVDTDTLVNIGGGPNNASPNSGATFFIGSLGIDASDGGGFDILTTTAGEQKAYAALFNSSGRSKLYSVNLDTGPATLLGDLGNGRRGVLGIALIPAAVPPAQPV